MGSKLSGFGTTHGLVWNGVESPGDTGRNAVGLPTTPICVHEFVTPQSVIKKVALTPVAVWPAPLPSTIVLCTVALKIFGVAGQLN